MPEVRSQEYLGHISVISMISQSHAKLRPDIVKFCNVMASYGQDMPRYAKFILYIISFYHFVNTTFYLSQKFFGHKFHWPQNQLGLKIILGI